MSPLRKTVASGNRVWTASSCFLNVDLHIRSHEPLGPLLKEWKQLARIPDSKPSHRARWVLVNLPGQPKTAEAAIRALRRLVTKLSKAGRQAWTSARSRTFDIGIQAGLAPYSFEDVRLAAETVQAVADLQGGILVTVYAPHDEAPKPSRTRVASLPLPLLPQDAAGIRSRRQAVQGGRGRICSACVMDFTNDLPK
jgi:hypothetical protein